jgi:hypothetical protein
MLTHGFVRKPVDLLDVEETGVEPGRNRTTAFRAKIEG